MEKTKKVTFYIKASIIQSLKYKAVTEEKTLSSLAEELLIQGIENKYTNIIPTQK